MERKCDCEAIHTDLVEKTSKKMPKLNLLYDLSDFFKIMGDGTRIQLLWALLENEMCVGDLASLLNMTKSAVSHQLKTLKTAKLIKSRKSGKLVFYSLDDSHIKGILEVSLEHICEKE
ncbi:bacterial regulatory, arsR family protein [Clostridioides difficile CD160]|nr:bacterial regulatory, arsR family protein [Clostridioides difficile CD160]MBY2475575.1 metalloregulator ArsR/SmtB family transcription factor [Clostridioides difficile]